MSPHSIVVNVLCIGHASYDLIFSVTQHLGADEKVFAQGFSASGGGPAANAAVQVAKLGLSAAFAGYLGRDLYGDKHLQELQSYAVNTDWVKRGEAPTPLSAIIVKPDGQRALINYKGDTQALPADALDFSGINPDVVLFDGHEPYISVPLAVALARKCIPTVLDAGSLHAGTTALMDKVEYLVCSEKFALQFAGSEVAALAQLATIAPAVVITLGERGLIWQRGSESGRMAAYPIAAIDTTGAGDAFHGAFAVALCAKLAWLDVLRYASAAGAFCCTKTGARQGLADKVEHAFLFAQPLVCN